MLIPQSRFESDLSGRNMIFCTLLFDTVSVREPAGAEKWAMGTELNGSKAEIMPLVKPMLVGQFEFTEWTPDKTCANTAPLHRLSNPQAIGNCCTCSDHYPWFLSPKGQHVALFVG